MCKFEKDKITYSKSQCKETYDISKNKPLLYPSVNFYRSQSRQHKFLQMARISFVVTGKTFYQTTALRFWRRCKNQMVKLSQNKVQNKTINLLSYILRAHTQIPLAFSFIQFVNLFLPLL